jgi:hypothetical protein
MKAWIFALASLPAALVACGDDGRQTTNNPTAAPTVGSIGTNPDTGTGTTDDATGADATAAPTTGAPTSGPPPGTSGTTDDATGGPKFDIGGGETDTTTAPPEMGCDKVDFLFVIDNSASMEDNQDALVAAFPGFIDTIKSTLEATSDYHIMVVDTDDDGRCKQPCDPNDSDYDGFCSSKNYHACTTQLTECDTTRGAGVVHPVGDFSSNKTCPIFGGYRYMLPEEPDLTATFSCVAKVGVAGNPSERPMNGMQEALTDAINGPGGCNEGFLRDDAILVITFISDDPNYEDQGVPADWYDDVVAAKNGDPGAVVVLGLIPLLDMGCDPGGQGDAIKGQHWREFVEMWGDRGVLGSICDLQSYNSFFETAVGTIDATCDNFMPPA